MPRKIIGAIITMLLSCTCLIACAKKSSNKPIEKNIGMQLMSDNSEIIAILGDEISQILMSPDKIQVYSLKPKSEIDPSDYETEPHFVRQDYIGNIDKNFISTIKFILLTNKDSYKNDSVVAQTFYLPLIELEYKKKKKSASVIISTNDQTWTVVSYGKRILNYNYASPELINRIVDGILKIKLSDK